MKKKNKKRINRKKIVIMLLVLIVLVISLIYIYFNSNKENNVIKSKSKVVDSIQKYGYTVSDTDTKLFKTKFRELKRLLSSENIDSQKYAELVGELFIVDFFSLDNKVTKNDVGGVEYVYSNYKTSFIDKARDQFYKFVKNDLNDDRNQELPEVSTIKVDSTEEIDASSVLKTDEFKNIEKAYKINLSWTYVKDLGYQSSATLIIIKDGDFKFSVAKVQSTDSSSNTEE